MGIIKRLVRSIVRIAAGVVTLITCISLVGIGAFLGGVVTSSLKRSHEFKLVALKSREADLKAARANNNEWVQWTRRSIAIIATLFIFVGPVIAMYTGHPTWVSFSETNGWLPAWLMGDTTIVWKNLPGGLVITPLHQYSFEAIIAFYFGSK
jgi:hypothetical protein